MAGADEVIAAFRAAVAVSVARAVRPAPVTVADDRPAAPG